MGNCSSHVIPLLNTKCDTRLVHALAVADAWQKAKVPTGVAMKASQQAHAAARAYTHPVDVAIARSIGQAVATAHMADHALGAALYALKAISLSGKSVEQERIWQIRQLKILPLNLKQFILNMLELKGHHFRFSRI